MKVLNHPYVPSSMRMYGYEPNSLDAISILAYFFAAVVCVLIATGLYIRQYKATFSRKLILCWFSVSGCIHIFLEGHFVYYSADISSRNDFLSQVWKEYAKGDSRYMVQDSFTVCMELITAVAWGPMCMLAVWAFVSRRPFRYLLQLVVSTGQLYGCVLYFATEFKDGFTHGPAYHLLYFWLYFVFMNVIWIIIPLILIADAWASLALLQSESDRRKKQ